MTIAPATATAPAPPQARARQDEGEHETVAVDAAEFSFDDLIDIINPLQHIPVVSTIYRAITGDDISTHARAVGGGLYGGPIGILSAGAVMAAEEAIGVESEGLLASLFGGEEDAPQTPPIQAAAAPPPPTPAQQALAATEARPQAPVQQPTLPFTAKNQTRFFPLPPRDAPLPTPTPMAAQAQAVPTTTGPMALSNSQADLLERFVAGAQADRPGAPAAFAGQLPPPEGATAEWFAARMQANLQKYAAAQTAGDQEAARASLQ